MDKGSEVANDDNQQSNSKFWQAGKQIPKNNPIMANDPIYNQVHNVTLVVTSPKSTRGGQR